MKEILLIRTDSGEKIKSLLNEGGVNYSIVYSDILAGENFSEEEFWRRSVRLASQDEQRNKEIVAWDKVASKVKDK